MSRWWSSRAPTSRSPTTWIAPSSDAGFDLDAGDRAGDDVACPPNGSRPSPAARRASLVPDRMLQLRGEDLDILIYPMDVLISGKPDDVPERGPRWPVA